MDTFRKELKELLTRYPQVESITYNVAETITKDTVFGLDIPKKSMDSGLIVDKVPAEVQKSVIDIAMAGMKQVKNI